MEESLPSLDTPFRYRYHTGPRKFAMKAKQFFVWGLNTAKGKPINMPDAFKYRVLKSYCRSFGLSIFVETGTFLGDSIAAMESVCSEIYSIEVQELFVTKARERFKENPNVHIIQGNSGTAMADVLRRIDKPALFWLDAHFPVGTARPGEIMCPVMDELTAVFSHRSDHVVLIDDAREFCGRDGYPTIGQVRDFVLGRFPNLKFSIASDIMRVHK